MIPVIAPGTSLLSAVSGVGLSLLVADNTAAGANLDDTVDGFKIFDISGLPTFVQATHTANAGDVFPTTLSSTLTINAALGTAFPAGSLIQNSNPAKALVENDDYVMDYERGAVRFDPTGANTVAAGEQYVIQAEYANSPATYINLGADTPQMEYALRMETRFIDGRSFRFTAPRCKIRADNPQLGFQPTDWASAELKIEILRSEDPNQAAHPFGQIRIGHNNLGVDPGASAKSYIAGVFTVYLTPLDPVVAAQKGFSMSEFTLGNITTGNIEAPQEYLDHFIGLPQVKDASILLKKEVNLTATVDQLHPRNLALLMDGDTVTDNTATFTKFATLLVVPTSPAIPQWIKLPFFDLNYA